MVKEFHDKAGHHAPDFICLTNHEVNHFRYKLIKEELDELEEALLQGDAMKTFDALLDLQYVLDGTFIQLGFMRYKQAGFEEVHRSNMTKDFPEKLENVPHKITKGKSYSPPDLEAVIFV